MKPLKLHIDNRPTEQPENTYPFAKNGVQFDLQGSTFNEPGFRRIVGAVIPYKFIGAIETDKYPVIFSTNNTNSAIGFFNTDTETYQAIIDDRTWNIFESDGITRSLLGFNTANYIRGQSQRNYKAELVVVFTDKMVFPMYLNCDNPSIKSINDLRLFAFFKSPNISVTMGSGGSVPVGAYYVAIGYEKNDGTSTQYSAVSNVVIVTPGTLIGTADKTLQILLTNVDTNYDFARLAIISTINGVTTANELTDYQPVAGGTINFTYTGTELTTSINISTVLTPAALYDQVGTMGQLNDYLYLGVLHEEVDLDDMQVYVNLIHLEWESQLLDATAPPTEHVNGIIKGFAHQETYAFYVRFNKTRGGKSKWFHTPGPDPQTGDLVPSSDAVSGGLTAPAFKVDDRIPYFNPVTLTGGFGFYQNDTELYPDTPDFDSTSIGGKNYRGLNVRHHRTPSQRWCANNLYSDNTSYGQTHLDILGVHAVGVRIPDKYKDIINGYEIGYAIRSVGNMTNFGQGALLHPMVDGLALNIPSATAPLYTSGGNFLTQVFAPASTDPHHNFQQMRTDAFRIHPFDILFNLPSINPNFVSAQFKLRKDGLNDNSPNGPYIEDGDISGNNTGPVEHIIDYTTSVSTIVKGTTPKLRHISSSFYCATGVNVGNMINYRHETAFCGFLDGTTFPMSSPSFSGLDYSNGNTHTSRALVFEETYIVNLIAVKPDIYQAFYSQQLTSTGKVFDLTDSSFIYGGDTFVSPYTFHTYGRHSSTDFEGEGIKGIKIARRIVCESVSNINLRFEITGNQYSDYWPKSSLIPNDVTNYLTLFDRSQEPNQFGYTKDFNALNSLIDSTIWNPFTEYIYEHPFRIHRGGKASRTSRPRSWRTFLALDYYEMQKNMGAMVNLEGMDDRLIIHMMNTLFLTQDKTQLQSGPIAVTLGSGDIFQFEPQEALSSKLGYAGTQHDLACVRTPFGYVFVDAKQGEIYIYKGKLTLLNEGINTILRDLLKITDVNVFTGNGITIGWDQKYKRILLTVKNKQLSNGQIIKPFIDTPDFWSSLTIGDIISYNGRYVQYQGLNNTSFNCPPDSVTQVITWQPINQFCVVDANNNNTGIKAWADRTRFINGVGDGFIEPNTAAGLGTFFPPVTDLTICPLPKPAITWIGDDGVCLKNDALSCPTGFILGSDNMCSQTQTQPATPPSGGGGTPGIAGKVNSVAWNNGGALVYAPGYNLDGSGPLSASLTVPHFWVNGAIQFDATTRNTVDGRMNVGGIWLQGQISNPLNEFIGFSRKITVATAQTIYVGMSADNNFKFLLNGVVLVDLTTNLGNISSVANFAYWNIYPVALRAGDNFIEMYAENFGDVAGFAAEIYQNSLADLMTATSETDLNIIFSTKNVVGEAFDLGQTVGFSCPTGWSFDPSTTSCIKTQVVAPSTVGGDTNNGMMAFNTRCRATNAVLDGFCEPNTNDGTGVGPFVPPIESPACIPSTPPSPTTIVLTGSIDLNCSNGDCSTDGFISLGINPSNIWPKFRLLIGQIVNKNNTVKQYVGSDIFGSIPGSTFADTDYFANGANLPFAIDIIPGIRTINGPIMQLNDLTNGLGNWLCNNCSKPVTDLYFKIDSVDPSDPNTYTLNLTTGNINITVHNM